MDKVIRKEDLIQDPQPFADQWRYCIGTGRLGLALRKEYLDALEQVQKDIGFRYIRGHGLFHEDIGIYQEYEWQGETKVLYNFHLIDQIFDSFLRMDLKPFIELGFMPHQIASGEQTIFWWKGNVTAPKDYQKWNELVRHTIQHFIERYGIEEVLTWPIEVWNEPNLVNFWEHADQKEYFKLYRETVWTIKSIHPDLQVGGPAICGGTDYWMKDFLDFCEQEGLPVDFLSRHAYSSEPPERIPFAVYQNLSPSDSLLNDFKSGREYLKDSAFPDVPVHITEFNTSYNPTNPLHDTAYNAAYLGRVISQGGDYADSFSYWTFSDVFEELGVPTSLFHGGFGLMAYHGIKKPTYFLYEFFAKLTGDTLYRDDEIHIVKRKDNSIALVAWNCVSEKEDVPPVEVTLELPVTDGFYFIKKSTVNEEVGNAWNAWRMMGRPRFPSAEQVTTLKGIAVPGITISQEQTSKGTLTVSFEMKKNEVTLVEIELVREETQPYDGLDDEKLISYRN